jgi:hypothetical protein
MLDFRSDVVEFESFSKIPRLFRECVITEKIDGTNAQVYVPEDSALPVLAGSRNRWVTPEADNFGFGAWVAAHADELREGLGPGRHYGEWWGAGIQRRYGLSEKRFSLFNVARWGDDAVRPKCCHVVPVLFNGTFDTDIVAAGMEMLRREGSMAAPGFMQPEGVVVWHEAARHFTDDALAALVMAIGIANLWNRLNCTTRQITGDHVAAYL